MAPLARILRLLRPRWATGLGVGLCIAVTSGSTAVYAWLAGPATTALYAAASHSTIPGELPSTLRTLTSDVRGAAIVLAVAIAATAIARSLATFGSAALLARIQQGLVRDLRLAVHAHLLGVLPGTLLAHPAGGLAARIAGDVQQVESLVGLALAPLARGVLTTFALGALALSVDPVLGVVALSALPFAAWLTARAGRRIRRDQRAAMRQTADLAGSVGETVQLLAVVRAYGGEATAREAFASDADIVRDLTVSARTRAAAVGPLIGGLLGVALAVTLVIASLRLAEGTLGAEAYVTFFAAVFFMYRPLSSLGFSVGAASASLAALDRVEGLLALEQAPAEPEDAVVLAALEQTLEVRKLSLSYGEREVLSEIDLTVQRGESLAIVGANGEGKTTLLLAIMGLVGPSTGEVLIDGQPVSRATRASVLRQFAWVSQEPMLFADTVLANIALGDGQPDLDRARVAARAAGAEELISRLPEGFDTVIAPGGGDLSVGERQRLCLARALYREAPVLLLDEPTAALDGPGARELGDTIESLLGHCTAIVVSHRESTVRRADRVVVLAGGRIVQDGRPADLGQRPGAYRELFAPLS